MLTMRRMGHVSPTCRHRKVYSGEMLPIADRWFWICTNLGCLATGSDRLDEAPQTSPGEYWAAMRKLNPECWVPASFRKTLG